ncbi:thiol reductant ABC exporter subunit CydD [Alkalimonas mucilaginosa]|uniref:Thiol reductant ABC exporter subunit CydD n=1 Tax=Alkalimonas mucilaginosa TaxID=3057676 RepID=A0ABU7JKU5_9GAMM|nr:thiol reductant ABC exporter subunit CydD [Alkalimonas sp. MEB004]MEE2025968.1 thiol reductant ABC exporter subunit CydD [Alkalimonas sp. MEB004]
MRGDAADVQAGKALLHAVIKQQRPLLTGAVLLGLLSTLGLIGQWLALAWLLGEVILPAERWQWSMAYPSVLLFLLALVLRAGAAWGQEYCASRASIAVRQSLRLQLLQLWREGPAWRLGELSAADWASQWGDNIETMDGYVARYWPQQYLALLSPLLMLALIAWLNWLMALILLLAAPLIPLFMVLVGLGAEQINRRHQLERQRLAGHFLNRVKQLRLLRQLDAIAQSSQQIARQSGRYRDLLMATLKVAFLSSAVLEFFASVAVASVAIYIGFVLFGAIDWGPAASISLFSGLTILLLAPEYFQPIRQFAQTYHDKAAALAAAMQLAPWLAKATEPDRSEPQPSDSRALQLTELVSAYPTQALRPPPVTLTVPEHHCLLLSGPSGSGKTTALKTLAGLIPAKAGAFHWPNKHHRMVYLPQQPWIKPGSWADNLRLYAPDASESDMMSVLEQLGLAPLLAEQTNGLATPLNPAVTALSGGQLQRLMLARALLAPASVLLLDEPTARLDQQSKALVMAVLAQRKSCQWLLIASHDPAMQQLADHYWFFAAVDAGTGLSEALL